MMPNFSTLGRRKQSPNKWRGGNEQRFMGDGQTFKGKLIGVLEVQEARGDRMCQDALLELKTAIKASGEHKQKVLIHIAVDGLKIRDEKTADCLYHHPVHKISFIAQDLSDSRAFGYIYGSPENGHRFFGIKTEKAASQVVVAMRDLFQVVFELKKKEMDEAKQLMNKENRDLLPHHANIQPMSVATFPDESAHLAGAASCLNPSAPPALSADSHHMRMGSDQASGFNAMTSGQGTASELAGLQNELEGIQAGIHQINKLTPSNAPLSFGTQSMLPIGILQPTSNFPVNQTQQHQQQQQQQQQQQPQHPSNTVRGNSQRSHRSNRHHSSSRGLPADPFGAAPFLPPPPPSKNSRYAHLQGQDSQNIYGTLGHPRVINNSLSSNDQSQPQQHQPITIPTLKPVPQPDISQLATSAGNDRYAVFDALGSNQDRVKAQSSIVATTSIGFENNFTSSASGFSSEGCGFKSSNIYSHTLNPKMMSSSTGPPMMVSSMDSTTSNRSDSFTDLDPLGTGKSRPYYDKKDFFTDLKQPSPRSGADSGSGPSSLVSQPSGPAPIVPLASLTAQVQTSSETGFGAVFPTTTETSQSRAIPIAASGILAPPGKAGSAGVRPIYGYVQGFGFSDYLTESHPSDRNVSTPRPAAGSNSLNRAAVSQMQAAWDSQDIHQDGSQASSFNTSEFAQDNIYEVCGEGSSGMSAHVEITVQGSPNPLQVHLPPEEGRTEEDIATARYGSIPHLDASPRRYRYIDSDECLQSDSPSSSLIVPSLIRHGSLSQSGANEASDSPPKLPERAPKLSHTGAPPPLPPKKPLSNQSSKTSIKNASMNNVALMAACFAESVKSDDIYDFPPEPMIGNVNMNQEETKQCISDILKTQPTRQQVKPVLPDLGSVSIEELSRMSVMELNEKMIAGLLPRELSGMSIFELVEFVAKHMRLKKDFDEEQKECAVETVANSCQANNSSMVVSITSSFSDNFIAEKLLSKPQPAPCNILPQISSNITTEIIPGITMPAMLSTQHSTSSNNQDQLSSKGFEDDFAHFHLPTSSISGRDSSVSDSLTDQERENAYDKYAVFRELQMEEELLRAWKTPSEEEKDAEDEAAEDEDDKSEEEEEGDGDKDTGDDLMADEEDERPICSSEGSPRSRSDTGSIQKSVSEDGTLDDLKIGSEVGDDAHDPKRESQIPIFFVEEGNELSEEEEEVGHGEDSAAQPENQTLEEGNHTFETDQFEEHHFENHQAEVYEQREKSEPQPDSNKFEHNFDEAFGPAGDLTITKDWTTFDDGPADPNQESSLFQDMDQASSQPECAIDPDSLEEEKEREMEFERLREQELRQQQQLYEEHQRLQEELQHQHALQRELQFHQQELHYHQQELQLQQEQQHQQQLRYHLLSETNHEQDPTRNQLQAEPQNKHFECVNKDYPNVVPSHAVPSGAERRNSQLSRRLQDEPSIASNQYSSSEGSSNNSPMLRIVGERRGTQNQYRSNPHYVNTQGHHQPYLHHPSHAQYPLQYSHSGRCLENHHWELVNQVAHEKPYEDPRYQPEFMSSFGNGVRNRDSNRSSNRSRHQSNSSEVWNTMDEERRQPHTKNSQPFRSASSFAIQSGVASPFNDSFTVQSRGSPATDNPPVRLKQQLTNDVTWHEPAPATAAVNGRRSVGITSCPGDYAVATDIFDSSKDILSGASFKILARVIPNSPQLADGQQQVHQQLSLPNSDDGSEIPKSNSVNIFAIKDDPFADDFFLQ